MEYNRWGGLLDRVELGYFTVLKNVIGIRLADLYHFSVTLLDDVYSLIILFHHSILNKIYGN